MGDRMLLKISHRTSYTYDGQAPYALQQLRLEPQSGPGQTVKSWSVETDGAKEELSFHDHNGNKVSLISFDGAGSEVHIVCKGEVDTEDTAGIVGQHKAALPLWYFSRATDLTRAGNSVKQITKDLRADFADDVAMMHALSKRVIEAVAYEPGHTDASTSAEDALKLGYGVCQDHAHIFIGAARYLGFPARYVSGYLMMPDREHQDASHAWAEVHLPSLGWLGIDVSNQISPDEKYVRIASGLDYTEAAPVSGISFGEHAEIMSVQIQVQQ